MIRQNIKLQKRSFHSHFVIKISPLRTQTCRSDTHEYIRVTYEYIKTQMATYRLHTNTCLLVTFEYKGATYDGKRVINMKCTILFFYILFLNVRGSCLAHTLHTCATNARVPHTGVCGPTHRRVCHTHTQTNLNVTATHSRRNFNCVQSS